MQLFKVNGKAFKCIYSRLTECTGKCKGTKWSEETLPCSPNLKQNKSTEISKCKHEGCESYDQSDWLMDAN